MVAVTRRSVCQVAGWLAAPLAALLAVILGQPDWLHIDAGINPGAALLRPLREAQSFHAFAAVRDKMTTLAPSNGCLRRRCAVR